MSLRLILIFGQCSRHDVHVKPLLQKLKRDDPIDQNNWGASRIISCVALDVTFSGSRFLTTDQSVRIDPAAVAVLHTDHGEELRAFLMGVLRNSDQVQDVMQMTFGKAIEFGHTARQGSLKGWLFRVAYHEALVLRRKQGAQQRSLAKLAVQLHRESEAPDRRLARQDTNQRVREALERLACEQRMVVQKRIYEDKTFAVIANELGVPLGTVLTRMRVALQKLRRDLHSQE